MIEALKPIIGKLAQFAQKRMGFKAPPKLFFNNCEQNSQKMLGKTAHYDPSEKSITIFIHSRHPKDILRSFTHELVHHAQNLRGDLTPEKCGELGDNYAQDNEHMRNMEKEAYLEGNMCFRDWEDSLENKDIYTIKVAESKFLKENKKMTKKITKEFLRRAITRILTEEGPAMMAGEPGESPQDKVVRLMQLMGQYKPVAGGDIGVKQPQWLVDKLQEPDLRDDEVATGEYLDKLLKVAMNVYASEGGNEDPKTGHEPKADAGEEENRARAISDAVVAAAQGDLDAEVAKIDAVAQGESAIEEETVPDPSAADSDGRAMTDDDMVPHDTSLPTASEGKVMNPKDWESLRLGTPEAENALYEGRFAPRNQRVFEKLVKKWAK